MTVPHWRRALRRPSTVRCDAVVVGAGICGVCAALHLQRRGLPVEVLEQSVIGAGASGRNAGFLMRGAADHYAEAVRRYGRDAARTLWRWTEENLAGLRAEGADSLPSYRATPSALLALDSGQAAELREARRLLLEDGFDAPWQDSGADSVWRSGRAAGALINPADAAVNPLELLRLLASRLLRPVRTNEEVCGLRADRERGVEVESSEGTYLAAHVLVCTNAYAPLLIPSLAPHVTPRRGQMLAIAPDAAAGVRLDASYYANNGSEYFRKAADGTLVVGGCRTCHADDEVGYDDRATPAVQRDIEAFADSVLGADLPPDWARRAITSRWAGTMGFSADGLPLIGPVPGFEGRVWFCGAFTGHGMSLAWRASKSAVAAMLDGDPTPFPLDRRAVPGPQAAPARPGAAR